MSQSNKEKLTKKEIQKLQEILKDYQILINKLQDPEILKNLDFYTELNVKIKKIEETALTYKEYQNLLEQENEWKEIISQDPSFSNSGKSELISISNKKNQIVKKIYNLFQKNNPKKKYNFTIIEIRGAAGGREANLFAGELADMYFNYCKQKKWKYEIWEANRTEDGGYSGIVFIIKNKEAFPFLKFEAGVHRVQRIPKTESSGRIHTSTATVAVLEEKTFEDVAIQTKDLRIDTFRSSGAGGQHVNTTDSAVRVLHIPTGLIVSCQDGRSQHDNKDKAMRVLRARLFKLQTTKFQAENISERKQQIGEGERSEKIRTYNFPQNRITDHRINLTIKNIDQVLNGKMDDLLEALQALNE